MDIGKESLIYNVTRKKRKEKRLSYNPWILSKDDNGNLRCRPIVSRVVSLYAEQNDLEFAVSGGLIW